jgi:hypothetical protein
VSTGTGPFTIYKSTGGGGRKGGSGSGAAATPVQRHEAATQAWVHIDQMHLGTCVPATRQVAPAVRLPKFAKLVATARKQALRGVQPLDRPARKAAKVQAHAQAETWAQDLMVLAERDQQGRQASIDESWSALVNNDPATVMRTLAGSLTGAGAPARVTYVDDGVAGLVVTGPRLEELPAEKPSVTPAGAPTVAKLNKTDLATATNKLIAARVILVVRQCFAAAPGLTGVSVVVVDPANSQPRLAASFDRQRFESTSRGAEPSSTLAACASELVHKPSGRTGELGVIALASDSAYGRALGR